MFITYSFDIANIIKYITSLIVVNSHCRISLQNFNDIFTKNKKAKNEVLFEVNKIKNNIKKDTVNVLIGHNGIGKSMLLKTLCDNIDSSILLPDNKGLLNISINDNIILDNNDDELNDILELVQFDINNISDGIDKIIDVGYSNISGGELLRICLARTLYHSDNVILIDDNFTSIDFNMREKIFTHFMKINKTIVFVDQQTRDYYKDFNYIFLENYVNS